MGSKTHMDYLYTPLNALKAYSDLRDCVKNAGAQYAYGLDESQRVHLLCALMRDTNRPMIVVCPNDNIAARMVEDYNQLMGGGAQMLPTREVSFLRAAASSKELSLRRLEALGAFTEGDVRFLAVPADALMHRLMKRERFMEARIEIEEGQQLEPMDLIARLIRAGYERVEIVEARGQCALRGGILDVFPVGHANAIRIEFFDDEIDSLRDFDVMTQRSVNRLTKARMYPANEVLLTEEESKTAAMHLENLLSVRQKEETEDRQRLIEKEFDLIPFEEFFEITGSDEGKLEDMPSLFDLTGKKKKEKKQDKKAPPLKTALQRKYTPTVDALRSGRYVDGKDALIHLLYEETDTLFEYREDALIVMDQPDRLRERCENRQLEFEEYFKAAMERDEAIPEQADLLLSFDYLLARSDNRSVLVLQPFLRQQADFRFKGLYKFEGMSATGYSGNMKELSRDIAKWKKEGWKIALFAGGVARGKRLNHALTEENQVVPFLEEEPETLLDGVPVILSKGISKGFVYPEIRFAVISEGDIFGHGKQRTRAVTRSGSKMAAFTDLNVGDYVVHENHGIGQYMGTVRLSSEGKYRDFLHIRYNGTDKLYVPTDQMDRVQKYIGSEGEIPKLNKLSGGEWQKQKARVKSSIKEIAGDLIKLYAERKAVPGHAFSADTPWQREFEDAFPFEETPDQLVAIEDIKRDMEKAQVMDRLLCGDVGYGKTEVALRAIFKCIMDGKQAALLAPTTILVQQHYATMLNRFHNFPVEIDSLSRFKTAAEQKQTIEKLKNGKIDVIVGTHRLLNKDIEYKDLGLLVVDEEQRFGVGHKEAIKQYKKSIDVLTLSATPIPRTLHMSMVGIRDMSLLQSPPEERYPVQTYVVEYSDGLVRDAILREMSRGGQVYVLHNRVQTIDMMYQRLKKLVPEARIAVGHGQMKEHALEDVMLDFYEGKFDVLLCTTIIEAGLDVPRANTLIVCDSDRFGLSQLYQLRGRVGRSNRLAYAYLTVNPSKVLTQDAEKRLSAIREFTEFGSGFRVAMRDLEIRGTGNILGAEQSGHMAAVGYDLYVKMIDETVREMRGDIRQGDIQTRIEIKADAYLPSEYVQSDVMRVEMYKKIAGIDSNEAREDLIEELIDRFGDPSRPVMNLIDIAQLKSLCSRIGIDLVQGKGDQLQMRFSNMADLDIIQLLTAIEPMKKCLRFTPSNPPVLSYFEIGRKQEELVKGAVEAMEKIIEKVAPKAEETKAEGE
ncbi:MAG: transcription-repair coupling factor [Clostridia bacterium]|nr:transcription-repair coupling factor [Clostridia bacterium]